MTQTDSKPEAPVTFHIEFMIAIWALCGGKWLEFNKLLKEGPMAEAAVIAGGWEKNWFVPEVYRTLMDDLLETCI